MHGAHALRARYARTHTYTHTHTHILQHTQEILGKEDANVTQSDQYNCDDAYMARARHKVDVPIGGGLWPA